MRCPKCQYVGFEPSPRCKNCGYDFSLSAGPADLAESGDGSSLTLVTEPEFEGPMADFDLHTLDDAPARAAAGAKPFDLDDLLATGRRESAREPAIAPVSAVARRRQSTSGSASAVATPPPMEIEAVFKPARTVEAAAAPVTTELPLFMKGMADAMETPIVHAPVPSSVEAAAVEVDADADTDADVETVAVPPARTDTVEIDDRPLVQVPAVPRAPLAVRRPTPDPARLRAKYDRTPRAQAHRIEESGDLLGGADQLDANLETRAVPPSERLSAEPTPTSLPAEWMQGAGPAKRVLAAAVDSALLVGLDAAVIWFTLSVCGLAPAQANLLPAVPLVLFFLLLDAGYLVLFTAACGQTIGKMAAGIRVVGTSTGAVINDRITLAQAVVRSLASIVSMLPLGAGFWFGLVGDRRAVHDRLTHTRVVAA